MQWAACQTEDTMFCPELESSTAPDHHLRNWIRRQASINLLGGFHMDDRCGARLLGSVHCRDELTADPVRTVHFTLAIISSCKRVGCSHCNMKASSVQLMRYVWHLEGKRSDAPLRTGTKLFVQRARTAHLTGY